MFLRNVGNGVTSQKTPFFIVTAVEASNLNKIFLLVPWKIFFRRLHFPSCGTPSPTRGRVCNLPVQLLLGLASAVSLRSKLRRAPDHILLSHLRLGSLSVAWYDLQSYDGGILSRLHSGVTGLTSPAYNISVRTAQKTPFLDYCAIVSVPM
jgi:hypothetical protein